MKQFKSIFIVLLGFILFTGCSGLQPKKVDKNYSAYLTAVKQQVIPPTFEIECPPGGCTFNTLKYFDPRDRLKIRQKNPHPGWALAGTAIKYGTAAYGIHEFLGFATSAVVHAGSNYNNSNNDTAGDNVQSTIRAGRDVGSTTIDDRSVENFSSFNQDDHTVTTTPVDPVEPPPEE